MAVPERSLKALRSTTTAIRERSKPKSSLRVVAKVSTGRECDACGQPYYRGNRLRVWRVVQDHDRMLYERTDSKLCTKCLKARSVAAVIRLTSVS
jgi:hypothetical protein